MTTKILHDADCPVWTGVHLEEAPEVEKIHFRTILAAVDLGPQSEKTLAWAAAMAAACDARLVVLHATPPAGGRAGESAEAIAKVEKLQASVSPRWCARRPGRSRPA